MGLCPGAQRLLPTPHPDPQPPAREGGATSDVRGARGRAHQHLLPALRGAHLLALQGVRRSQGLRGRPSARRVPAPEGGIPPGVGGVGTVGRFPGAIPTLLRPPERAERRHRHAGGGERPHPGHHHADGGDLPHHRGGAALCVRSPPPPPPDPVRGVCMVWDPHAVACVHLVGRSWEGNARCRHGMRVFPGQCHQ